VVTSHDRGYRLIDAGDGRRLERFGPWLLDRPAPGATEPRRTPDAWGEAIAFHPGFGWHRGPDAVDALPPAQVELAGCQLELRLADGGQVGVYPEHAAQAGWVATAVGRRTGPSEPPQVLNLFAATGLLTLVAARAGAQVAHLDAARGAVAWARENAALSGLTDRPIRWLVDDALEFVQREGRRGRRYDGFILDPPSYGHGKRARSWDIDRDLDALLDGCAALASDDAFWLLTTHSTGWDGVRLASALADGTGMRRHAIDVEPLALLAESGARLELGFAARHDPVAAERR
jgi:23S rRNA (cytosine1962-C5)-methyltransferase